MPNVLNEATLRAFAQRVALKIPDERVRARFACLAFRRLHSEARNFRPATGADIECGPEWARAAAARGDQLVVFAVNRGAAQILHNLARRLAVTCKLAEVAHGGPGVVAAAAQARSFLARFDRVSFDFAALRGRQFAHIVSALADSRDAEPLCAPAALPATHGRCWRRVVSLSELRAIGHEFRNCLARLEADSTYASLFVQERVQYWLLRGPKGDGRMLAMVGLEGPARFMDVRGRRNAPVRPRNPDLACLASALFLPAWTCGAVTERANDRRP
jgi:hypothetical protein